MPNGVGQSTHSILKGFSGGEVFLDIRLCMGFPTEMSGKEDFFIHMVEFLNDSTFRRFLPGIRY